MCPSEHVAGLGGAAGLSGVCFREKITAAILFSAIFIFACCIPSLRAAVPTSVFSPDTTAIADSLYRFGIKGSDADVSPDTIDFFLLAAPVSPSKMTLTRISPDSAYLSWRPARSQAGTHNIVVKMTDAQGETAELRFNIHVTYVNFPPVFTINPADTTAVDERAFSRKLYASDFNANDSLRFSLLSGPYGMTVDSLTGVLSWFPDEPNLRDTSAVVRVRDRVGGFDTTQFNIDVSDANDPPVLTVLADTLIYEDRPFTRTLTASDEDTGSTIRFFGDTTFFHVDSITGTFSFTPVIADTGSHTVQLRARDNNLAADTVLWNLTIAAANDPPVFGTVPANTTVLEGQTWTFTVTATDEEPGTHLTYSDNTPLFVIHPDSGKISFSAAGNVFGAHLVSLYVSDGAKSDTATFTLTVQNVNNPPVLQAVPDTIVSEDQFVTLAFTAADPDSNPHLIFRDTSAFLAVDSLTGIVQFTPDKGDTGVHTVLLTVSDGSLLDSAVFRVTVLPVNHAPVIVPVSSQTVLVGLPFTIDINASDIETNSTIRFSDDSPFFAINAQTGLIQFVPSAAQVGTHSISVIATDGSLSDTLTFSLTIRLPNNPPVIDGPPDLVIDEDVLFSYTVGASDADAGEVLKFYDNTPLFDIDSLSGTISFTPSNGDTGVHPVTIRVSDGFDADTASFVLTVRNINDNPQITSVPDSLTAEGEDYSYQVTAVDPDNTVLIYELLRFPSGMRINPATGLITWKPTASHAGDYQIDIRVTDGIGGIALGSYVLRALPVNDPPEIINFPALSFMEDDSLTLDLTPYGLDPDNARETLIWSAAGAVQLGVTLTGSRGIIIRAPRDWFGRDSLQFIVRDPVGLADSLRAEVVVAGAPDPPRVRQDTVRLALYQDRSISTLPAAWVADPDGDRIAWSFSKSLVIGVQYSIETGIATFTPVAGFRGVEVFTAIGRDSSGLRDSTRVKVTVLPINQAPVFLSYYPGQDTVHIPKGNAADFGFEASDADGDELQAVWAEEGAPPLGTGSTLRYLPPSGFTGMRRLDLALFDGRHTVRKSWILVVEEVSAVFWEEIRIEAAGDGVEIRWETEAGNGDATQFHIRRRGSGSDRFETLAGTPVRTPGSGYRFSDREVEAGEQYEYIIQALFPSGAVSESAPLSVYISYPEAWRLGQNYPNPFNSGTRIPFTVPKSAPIIISVYSLQGELVRELYRGIGEAGYHVFTWDGRDASGLPAASGIYFVVLHGGKVPLSRKLLLIR